MTALLGDVVRIEKDEDDTLRTAAGMVPSCWARPYRRAGFWTRFVRLVGLEELRDLGLLIRALTLIPYSESRPHGDQVVHRNSCGAGEREGRRRGLNQTCFENNLRIDGHACDVAE